MDLEIKGYEQRMADTADDLQKLQSSQEIVASQLQTMRSSTGNSEVEMQTAQDKLVLELAEKNAQQAK